MKLFKINNDATNKLKDEVEVLRNLTKTYEKKLMFARNVTEQKLLESISDPHFFREEPHLVQVYTATLNEEEYKESECVEVVSDNGLPIRSRKDKFLLGVTKNLDIEDPNHAVHLERLDHMKNLILDRVKATNLNKLRSRTESTGSRESKRRLSLSLIENVERDTSRPRTKSPSSS